MKADTSWLKLAGVIADNVPAVPALTCPDCGQQKVDFQYVGDGDTRLGFLCLWCTSCLHGKHVSRVRIPQKADFISIHSTQEVKERIPNFK